jgi:hypothetical protein
MSWSVIANAVTLAFLANANTSDGCKLPSEWVV